MKRQNNSKFSKGGIKSQQQRKTDLKDIDILNKKADKLNKEAKDVLSYQLLGMEK
ncbi:MAG: hypothetical protein HZA06_01500 [Nitrospirae bacterium]|nr:hypothetical protein [Nitrospirota bacterium]